MGEMYRIYLREHLINTGMFGCFLLVLAGLDIYLSISFTAGTGGHGMLSTLFGFMAGLFVAGSVLCFKKAYKSCEELEKLGSKEDYV